jgi:2-oxoglutarate ferredoxin oxidoreductase subunit delta
MKSWRKALNETNVVASLVRVSIDQERCKGCGYCVEFCPREVLKMSQEFNSKGYPLPSAEDESRCLECGFCEAICPEFAVTVRRKSPNQ